MGMNIKNSFKVPKTPATKLKKKTKKIKKAAAPGDSEQDSETLMRSSMVATDGDAEDDDEEEEDSGDDENNEDEESSPSKGDQIDYSESSGKENVKSSATRHIRPCVCDLPARSRQKIQEFQSKQREFQQRFEDRKQEIENEIARLEEEKLEKERERKEQEALFEDEYEMVGHKKKRKKRSARRASMVSLGIKQVINSANPPKIKVHLNKVFELRRTHHTYCGKYYKPYLPDIGHIDYHDEPKIPVRATLSSQLRFKFNENKKDALTKAEDKREPFRSYFIR